jgi:hypothetical protein
MSVPRPVRLALVLLGVENVVRNLRLLQHASDGIGLLDAGRAHQHGLAIDMRLADLCDQGFELLALGLVDDVFGVGSRDRLVRRNDDDVELVDVVKLGGFRVRSTSHPGELVVEAEEVLEGNRGQRDVLALDGNPLLRFDGLMQTVGPATPSQDAAGELVDDQDLAVLGDHVVLIAMVERVRSKTLLQNVKRLDVDRVVEIAVARQESASREELLSQLHPLFRQRAAPALLVELVVLVLA